MLVTVHCNVECLIDLRITCKEIKGINYRHEWLQYCVLSWLVHHVPHRQALSLASQELWVAGNIREKYDLGNWQKGNRAWQSRSICCVFQAATMQCLVMTSWKMKDELGVHCSASQTLKCAKMFTFLLSWERAQRNIKLIQSRWCFADRVWQLSEIGLCHGLMVCTALFSAG